MMLKKNIGLSLTAALLLTAMLTACGGSESPAKTDAPTEAPPTTETPTAPEKTEPATEAPAEVNCLITVTDQDGSPMTGLDVTLVSANEEAYALKTNDQGVCESVTLIEGKYAVSYSELPFGYLPYDTELTVVKDTDRYTLVVTNNNPNGTEERPYIIPDATTTAVIPAGATHMYMSYGAKDCAFTLISGHVTVTYRDTVYTPDANGTIHFPFISDGPRDPVYLTFSNPTDADVEFTFSVEPVPGSYSNPILIENAGEVVTATIIDNQSVYYKWIATKSGVAVVSSTSEKNHIAMTNMTTAGNSYFTEGSACEYLLVAEGDEVLIVVSAIGSEESIDIPFAMNAYAGTETDPLPILKDESILVQVSGESRTYIYVGDATTLRVTGVGVKITVGGTVYEADADGKLEVALTAGEQVLFVMENTTDTYVEITLKLS